MQHMDDGWILFPMTSLHVINFCLIFFPIFQKDDLKAVVDYLRADGNVSLIGLWGRSMGAVTSLMYGAEDPSIAGIVLDSPFSDLVELMLELVDTYKFRLPKFTVKFAIQFMRKSIQKKAKFDITDLNTIKVAKSCFVPALFGHAIGDDFIRPHHSDRIFEAYMEFSTISYKGDKNIIKFEGDHNSPRPQFYFDSINIFFHNVLQPPEDEVGATLYDSIHDYFGKVPSDIPSEENLPGCQDKDTVDNGSSSSNMISFELSNGHPFDPHVRTAMDDDQYVEYQLDDLTGFPCNVEEEERMFMEAIIESLKDLDMRQPQTEEQAKACADSSESAKKDEINGRDTCSTPEKSSSLPLESTSTQVVHDQVPFETQSTLVINGSNVGLEHASPDTSVSSLGRAFDRPLSTEETVSTSCARTDTSASTQSSSDADMSGSTKATVTVVRNPSNNIMDGLMRRWDLNFFRNSR
ncbi:GTP_EFTU_D3 domain-containing protein/Abhydrolase_5 domain-containing protein [Gossypium australe]|uniref:GTP_EFTU_D3 domain-containing protein/Abhydrolase_5 domain-containing protein n=1 Tax=Gossypium australe TaxID=47621 RepID=A0A5B6WFN2_9ROSI|nr:GTP_EFTU_D3 domain-containing protein/Abhydrolase_5 domain-containing protein [Gossypium australe]